MCDHCKISNEKALHEKRGLIESEMKTDLDV